MLSQLRLITLSKHACDSSYRPTGSGKNIYNTFSGSTKFWLVFNWSDTWVDNQAPPISYRLFSFVLPNYTIGHIILNSHGDPKHTTS